MRRLVWFLVLAILGLGMLICGLLVPIHLRAVDTSVLELAGKRSVSLVDKGLALAGQKQLGAAQLVSKAAQEQNLAGSEKLELEVANLARQHSRWEVWGGPEPRFESIFQPDARLPQSGFESFTQYIVRPANRDRVLVSARESPRPWCASCSSFGRRPTPYVPAREIVFRPGLGCGSFDLRTAGRCRSIGARLEQRRVDSGDPKQSGRQLAAL